MNIVSVAMVLFGKCIIVYVSVGTNIFVLDLVVVVQDATVLTQFDAIFAADFYIFAIPDARLYNKGVLSEQCRDCWVHC